jgi:beta-N-acetylglucosaminidase
MNKTKLALLGATVATIISFQSVSLLEAQKSLEGLKNEVKMTIESKEFEIKVLKEELTKSKDKAEENKETIETLEQEVENLKKEISMRGVKYNPNDITEKSNITVAKLESFLEGTALKGLSGAFKRAEEQYGINALFLVGLVANESGWGKSEKAVKYNNMTGHAVYSGLSRGSVFSSKDQSIMNTAELLATEYLQEGGEHYNGKSIWQVNIKYCQDKGKPNPIWSKTINDIASSAVKAINQ